MKNKKMISLLMVGLLSSSLLVGCKSTQDETVEVVTEKMQGVSQERLLEIQNEIEQDLPYECMEVGTYEGTNWLLCVYYKYDPMEEGDLNLKQDREKLANEMIDYHKELNEKYNSEGVKVNVKITYTYDEYSKYYLITNEYIDDSCFIEK